MLCTIVIQLDGMKKMWEYSNMLPLDWISYAQCRSLCKGGMNALRKALVYLVVHELSKTESCEEVVSNISKLVPEMLSSLLLQSMDASFHRFVCYHGRHGRWHSANHVGAHAIVERSPSFLGKNGLDGPDHASILG